MPEFGAISYSTAALFFLVFAVLLSTSWRGRLQGGLLLSAAALSMLWAAAATVAGKTNLLGLQPFLALEVARNTVWLAFLWNLLSYTRSASAGKWSHPVVLAFAALAVFTVATELYQPLAAAVNALLGMNFQILSHVIQAVAGIVVVEQLFRNTRLEQRWAIKFLCIGIGVVFAYDFMLFSEALLFNRIDVSIWNARGFVNALTVPLIAIAAARNPRWSVDIFISRSMVFHTTGLMAAGIYLLLAAVAGYYIRDYGGSWGRAGQIIFLAGALLILLVLMFSGHIRARMRVFLSRHFFAYKYDYRKEWLDLNRTVAEGDSAEKLREACIRGITDIVDSKGGLMWLIRERGQYELASELNLHPTCLNRVDGNDPLVRFLTEHKWVVDIPEYKRTPELYEGLDLSNWCESIPELWLITPLVHRNELYGFIGLAGPRAPRDINWEDHDLLKTVGQQLASYVGLIDASDALASARQFEAYNRLSAFIVHDLKNLVTQLSMIVENAERHKNNPAFIDDAVETLSDSVRKMNRLLSQLRKGDIGRNNRRSISLSSALENVVEQQSQTKPKPELTSTDPDLTLVADANRLIAILAHLVQNAQDATDNDGWVRLRCYRDTDKIAIKIQDNGSGMDRAFVRERLFKPFDTTKGNAGMGIGVYEARQFVRELNGDLQVDSEPDHGTTFTLTFPLDRPPAVERSLAANHEPANQ